MKEAMNIFNNKLNVNKMLYDIFFNQVFLRATTKTNLSI